MYDEPIIYGVKNLNENVRMASRSGGVFTALSDAILQEGGSVYGCGMDRNFYVLHRRAVTEEDRDNLRKSKYCQSDMGEIYNKVKEDLMEGMKVLFSGTSCQVAGLLSLKSSWGGG